MRLKNDFHHATIVQNINIIQMDIDYALELLDKGNSMIDPLTPHQLVVATLCIKNAMARFNLLKEVYEEANK